MAIDKFQKKLLDKLRNYDENNYADASLYTVLLDLCEGNGVNNVQAMLIEVANDMEESIVITLNR